MHLLKKGRELIVFRVKDKDEASEIFRNNNIKLLASKQIYNI